MRRSQHVSGPAKHCSTLRQLGQLVMSDETSSHLDTEPIATMRRQWHQLGLIYGNAEGYFTAHRPTRLTDEPLARRARTTTLNR